jgi:hypothetical protein
MAQVKCFETPGALISTFTWAGLRNGDRGEPIRNAANVSFQVDGDFGLNGKVVIETSNDGQVYKTAADRRGHPALVTAPWLRTIPNEAEFIRPRVYGGNEVTLITVIAVFRRPGR